MCHAVAGNPVVHPEVGPLGRSGPGSGPVHYYYYCVYLFIWRPTVALHLCASAGQKTGFGAQMKCKSDASDEPDVSDASYIQRQCVWGGVWGGG